MKKKEHKRQGKSEIQQLPAAEKNETDTEKKGFSAFDSRQVSVRMNSIYQEAAR